MASEPRSFDSILNEKFVPRMFLTKTYRMDDKDWIAVGEHWFAYSKCARCGREHLPTISIETPATKLSFSTSSPPLTEEQASGKLASFTTTVSINATLNEPISSSRIGTHYCLECFNELMRALVERHIEVVSVEQALTTPDPLVCAVASLICKGKENEKPIAST